MCLFNKKDKEKKYNINKIFNRPEMLYGTPDYILKEWEKEKQERKQRRKEITECVFSASIVNRLGSSRYYYINKVDNDYQFLYGYSSNGENIVNDIDNPYINYISRYEQYYNDFINQLIQSTEDWKDIYNEEETNDEVKWNIDFVKQGKKYSGVNVFPKNFNKVVELIEKYFAI